MKKNLSYVIKGIDPIARGMFAVEAMSGVERSAFTQQHAVYVCRNDQGIFFSKELSDAYIFKKKKEADYLIELFNEKETLRNCSWHIILLINGKIANTKYVKQ